MLSINSTKSLQYKTKLYYLLLVGSLHEKLEVVYTVFPRNLAAPIRRLVPINAALEISLHGKRVVGFQVCGMQVHAHDSHYRNGRVRRRKAGEWTSRHPRNLAALEISPQGAVT